MINLKRSTLSPVELFSQLCSISSSYSLKEMDLPEVRQPEAATGKGGGATRRQLSLLDSLREHLSFSLDVELLQNPFIIFFFKLTPKQQVAKAAVPLPYVHEGMSSLPVVI